MKIAIVGSGISGLYAAHYLSKQHQVTLYEAHSTLGGHTDTHSIVMRSETKTIREIKTMHSFDHKPRYGW